MKIIIVVSSRNIQFGRGMNRVIYNALPELKLIFDEIIIVSGTNFYELLRGLAKIIISNPISIKFMIFNAMSSIGSYNKYWIYFIKTALLFKIKPAIFWHEMPDHYQNYKESNLEVNNVAKHNKYLKNKNYLHLCVSTENSGIAKHFDRNPNINVINNCIKPRELFNQLLFDKFTVITLGVIDTIKGTDIWTDVAIKVCKENKKVQFVWCGSANDETMHQQCIEKIKNNNLQERILFLGHIEDASIFINASHLYYSSSRMDSFPLVVIEAMSFGKNIIYYDSGGTKEAAAGFATMIDDFDIDKTVISILNKITDFENNPNAIFNKKLYNRFYENYTPKKFAENLENALS